ncbi:cytochrome c oxidase assembly protein [Rhizobacter sp. AJA081-3]|jgi:cytochrome c oxidase assembly protein subunit 11|uniref:cytochrome c oxidase assembly protein n=1 Tax=Rhizobacter sp. AJA081-3 TaxID=2753607 RepID=UPI001ADEC140|nr:cytochrome c oxidase assembly protein [Rhizobacter sp. AJA081-3]QTN24208.1 cytochrome c oxidase assembly protein [Rhizobacter sp. AJA081-3]
MSNPPIGPDPTLRSDNLRMVGKLVVVAALMFGFGYALVPMYRAICSALGINVLSVAERQVPGNAPAERNTQVDTSRVVTVEFDANARGPWDFKPAKRSVDVHPGEMATVMYEFRNKQNRTMAAQAIPSYAPRQAMAHFNKIECFCFNEYTLKAGESKQWPVVFIVDPKLPKDVRTITLSYTFFEVGGKTPAEPEATVRAPVQEPRT